MNQYDFYVQKMMELLNAKEFCSSSKASHRECYQKFREYLMQYGLMYSPENANQWLKLVRENQCRQKYASWYKYMEQLQELIITGTVSDNHLALNKSFYDKVPEMLKIELDEYLQSRIETYSAKSSNLAKFYCSRIMVFFGERGLQTIRDITYADLSGFYCADLHCSKQTRYAYLSHARKMLSFFSEEGLCFKGYSMILDDKIYPYVGLVEKFAPENQNRIHTLRRESLDFPSNEFLTAIDDFVELLRNKGYASTALHNARHTLTVVFLFLDRNGLGYHPEIARIWFSEIQPVIGISWRNWRRILMTFEQYSTDGDIQSDKRYTYKPDQLDSFPDWCKKTITGFLQQLIRGFRRETTTRSYKYSCMRFCTFLIKHGISSFDSVTPTLIKEFTLTDIHETFNGRSDCFTVVRQFLRYLEEQDIIHNSTLHLGISTGTAPCVKIVDVLTDDEIHAIAEYRMTHGLPIELRNVAMVMTGLKFGFRASDVVNLKFSDIDWKSRTVSIIQQKTMTEITLPISNDVGNSLYSYIKKGRPNTDSNYIFVRHKAPYGKVTTKICNIALYTILPEREKIHHCGFHVTRKTFATNILRNNAGINAVMDSLGHHDNTSVMKYLSFDEERMRQCPLSLGECSLELKGEVV